MATRLDRLKAAKKSQRLTQAIQKPTARRSRVQSAVRQSELKKTAAANAQRRIGMTGKMSQRAVSKAVGGGESGFADQRRMMQQQRAERAKRFKPVTQGKFASQINQPGRRKSIAEKQSLLGASQGALQSIKDSQRVTSPTKQSDVIRERIANLPRTSKGRLTGSAGKQMEILRNQLNTATDEERRQRQSQINAERAQQQKIQDRQEASAQRATQQQIDQLFGRATPDQPIKRRGVDAPAPQQAAAPVEFDPNRLDDLRVKMAQGENLSPEEVREAVGLIRSQFAQTGEDPQPQIDSMLDRISQLQQEQGMAGDLRAEKDRIEMLDFTTQQARQREDIGRQEAEAARQQKDALDRSLAASGGEFSTRNQAIRSRIDENLNRSIQRRQEATNLQQDKLRLMQAGARFDEIQSYNDRIAEVKDDIFQEQKMALDRASKAAISSNLAADQAVSEFLSVMRDTDPGSERKVNVGLSDRLGYLVDDFGNPVGDQKVQIPQKQGAKKRPNYKLNKEAGYYYNPANPRDRIPVNDSTIVVEENQDGTFSARTSKSSDTSNMQVVASDSKNGANCVLYAREQVNNLPYGLFSIEDKERAIEMAGNKDMSQVNVGDAVLTKEGKYGHAAIVAGFDDQGNIILDEANYTPGQVTEGRVLDPNDSTVIGFVPDNGGVNEPAQIVNRENVEYEGSNDAPFQQAEKEAVLTQRWLAEIARVRAGKVTSSEFGSLLDKAERDGVLEQITSALNGGETLDRDLDTRGRVRASKDANKDKPPQGFNKELAKAKTVLGNIADLNNLIIDAEKEGEMGVLKGKLKNLDPWDTDAAQFKAILQSTVPNLARGVYGEVGVLTDADIRNYIQTLPRLDTTPEIAKMMTNMTATAAKRAIENTLSLYAGNYNVSDFEYLLDDIEDFMGDMENSQIPNLSSERANIPERVSKALQEMDLDIDALLQDYSLEEIEASLFSN